MVEENIFQKGRYLQKHQFRDFESVAWCLFLQQYARVSTTYKYDVQ